MQNPEKMIYIPISQETYNEIVFRLTDYDGSCGDVAGFIEDAIVASHLEALSGESGYGMWSDRYDDFLDNKLADEDINSYGPPHQGYQWKNLLLPNKTKIKMSYLGSAKYADVRHEKLVYEGKSYSPSVLAKVIAGGTSRNAWRDLWIKRPKDKDWVLADTARKQEG